MPTREPRHFRTVAESFGADAGRYDRARPGYPAELITRIAAAGADVLDVGTGTGIAARQLRAAGCRVLGLDPDARMAGLARDHGVPVEVARFEDWDPAGRTFDAVTAAQAWHWVDPVAGATRAARVLRPGGRLTVFWNVFEPPRALSEAFAVVYRRVLPQMPILFGRSAPVLDGYLPMITSTVDGIHAAGTFAPPEQWRFAWQRDYTRAEWLDQLPTHGGHHLLTAAQRDELSDGVGAAVDRAGGVFTMGYTTLAVTAALG